MRNQVTCPIVLQLMSPREGFKPTWPFSEVMHLTTGLSSCDLIILTGCRADVGFVRQVIKLIVLGLFRNHFSAK